MRNIALVIQYDGTNFKGYQKQRGERTVQEELEKAVRSLTGENNRIIGAGRTDAGVHASFQVVNFLTCSRIRPDKFYFHLVPLLPDDILPVASKEVDLNFHARFSAKEKTYRYLINLEKPMHPVYRNYMENITYKLDYDRLQEGLNLLKGRHDFSSFSVNDMEEGINPVREITRASYELSGKRLELYFSAESFLHNQVRMMAGSLIELSRGKLSLEDFEKFLDPACKKKATPSLRPGGLYLERIDF